MKLAIFSPSQNAYSETFIQAHKNNIKADKLYYIYGSSLESMVVENIGFLINSSKRLFVKGISKVLNKNQKPNFNKIAAKQLNSLNIDVALVEYGNHAMKLVEVFKLAKIPFVVHFHGYDISVKKVIEQNNHYKKLFKTANFVIGVSHLMCERLETLGCPQEKIKYNVYGANKNFEQIKPHFKNRQILSVGRFVDKKAPYYTILAFKKVLNTFPEAKLVMVGDGYLYNTCKNLVKLYKLEKNIELLGAVSPERIRDLMQTSYCFIQHSITAENGNQEGTPVAIMEAALAGLPIISTYHAGIPDVIEHKKTGLLSQEHDVNTMVDNILEILDNKSYAMKLGENAKKMHKEKFTLDRHIQIIEDLLIRSKK